MIGGGSEFEGAKRGVFKAFGSLISQIGYTQPNVNCTEWLGRTEANKGKTVFVRCCAIAGHVEWSWPQSSPHDDRQNHFTDHRHRWAR